MKNKILLIHIYCTICEHYSTVKAYCQRFSNNSRPKFTDEECIAIYFFGLISGHYTQKAIYEFILDYWHDWFPTLPSYKKFNKRINMLSGCIQSLYGILTGKLNSQSETIEHVLDSMPIILAKSKRSKKACVAPEICDKGYCATKEMYYYGCKLHILAQREQGTLPSERIVCISAASEHDLNVAKEYFSDLIQNLDLYLDKAYIDKKWQQEMLERNVKIFTPVKKSKKQEHLSAVDIAKNKSLSSVRETIEALFSWLLEKTHLQNASKVRSTCGLIAFIFARLCASAFLRF